MFKMKLEYKARYFRKPLTIASGSINLLPFALTINFRITYLIQRNPIHKTVHTNSKKQQNYNPESTKIKLEVRLVIKPLVTFEPG